MKHNKCTFFQFPIRGARVLDSRWPQDGFRLALIWPSRHFELIQAGFKLAQDGLKVTSSWFKLASSGLNIASSWLKLASIWPQVSLKLV